MTSPADPVYCTPEEVAETLDLPADYVDNYGRSTFTDTSHPSYAQVCRMIKANEDVIDRRTRRSWRTNYVKEHVLNIPKYWQDENAWRMEYYRQGGNCIQLRKDVLPWDPSPVYSDAAETVTVPSDEGYEPGKVAEIRGKRYIVDAVEPAGDDGISDPYLRDMLGGGGYVLTVRRELYGGDRLEVRTNLNTWQDMSDRCLGHGYVQSSAEEPPITDFDAFIVNDVSNNTFWFDYPGGRLFLKRRVYMPAAQGLRITYRYGSAEEVPAAINRLACILTASQVLNMQSYLVRLGAGGDIDGIRRSIQDGWNNEAASIWASYQRAGSVYSLMR